MVNPPLSSTRGIYTGNQILSPFDQPGPVTRSRSRSRNETLLTGTDDKTPHRLPFSSTDSNSSASSSGTTSSTRSSTSSDNQGREGTPITPPSDYSEDVKGLEAPPYAADLREVPTLLLLRRGLSGESSSDSREVRRPSTPQPTEEDEDPRSTGSTSAVARGLDFVEIHDESPTVRRVRALSLKKLADAAKAAKAAEAAEEAGEVDEDERIAGISKALRALGLDSESNDTKSAQEPEEIDEAVQEPDKTDEAVVSGASHGPQPEQQQQTSFNAADSSSSSGEDGVSIFPNPQTAVLSREVDEQSDAAITPTTRSPRPTSIPDNTAESALEDGLDATASLDVDRQADLNEGSCSTSVETVTPPRNPQNGESKRSAKVKENAAANEAAAKKAAVKEAREKEVAAKRESREKEAVAKKEARDKEAAAKRESRAKEAAAKKEARDKEAAAKKEATANETTATTATGVDPTSTGESSQSSRKRKEATQKASRANASGTPDTGEDSTSASETTSSQSSQEGEGAEQESSTVPAPTFFDYNERKLTRGEIRESILKIVKENKTKSQDEGYLYIYRSPKCPNHVKIGMTTDTPRVRIDKWGKCKLPIARVQDDKSVSFLHVQLAENLIKAELHNVRRKYTCHKCKRHKTSPPRQGEEATAKMVNHEEWYEISEEKALTTVHRWRDWLVSDRPYDEDGGLRPNWKLKLDYISKQIMTDEEKFLPALTQLLQLKEKILYLYRHSDKTVNDECLKIRTFILGLLEIAKKGVDLYYIVVLASEFAVAPFLRSSVRTEKTSTNSDSPRTPSELRTKLIQSRFPSYKTPGPASCDAVVLISIASTPLGARNCSYARIHSAMELNNSSERLGVSSHRGEGAAEHVLANAPYGKACLNCVRSKTRCLRLNKDCQPAPTIRKRKVAKRPKQSTASVASKTAALEEKLDDLTLILQRSQAAQTAPSSLASHSATSESSSQLENGNFGQSNSLVPGGNENSAATAASRGANGRQGAVESGKFFNYGRLNNNPSRLTKDQGDILSSQYAPPTPSESSSSTSNRTPCIAQYFRDDDPAISCPDQKADTMPPSFPTNCDPKELAELEESLETYRSKMAPFFPVVIIDKNVTARELIEERPFLSLVIRAISPKSTSQQAELGIEVRRVLGREMLIEGAKNTDLLLGLLVFASWGHFYVYSKPIISTVIHLATAVASDLGLTKPVPTEPSLIMLSYNAQGCPRSTTAVVRTMEERRSVIGLFLISSVSSCYFQRIEPLRWVPYFEECLQLLEKTKEHPTDMLLVFLTRLQLIKNAVSRDTSDNLCGGIASPPSEIYFRSLQSQLEELKRNTPPELDGNINVQLHLHHATLTLHEHCLGTCSSKPSPPDPSKTLQLSKSLWTCLEATKSWFALFVSADILPLSSYAEMPMALMAQMAHFIVALYRLSTFECPGVSWDRQLVRQEVDLGVMINVLTEKWGNVPAAAGLDTSGPGVYNIWLLTNRMLGKVASWWEMKVVAPAAAAAAAAADAESRQNLTMGHDNSGGNDGLQGFSAQGQIPMQDIDFGAANMDLLDDVWMRDLLAGDFPYQLDF
ncbi:hypothetical protein V494_04944 [Pseudogymnoascus sp. VKM F-4513 (FW-928)]|nr:hypothetical protein V494_04944 [Pseudogymnoascus sp. VKM F-4513 (FW-928)]